jgi:dihydrofolate reductase
MTLTPPKLNLIVACAQNRVIGLNGAMPWHIPAELQHFKQLTLGCPVIMGRNTWDSIMASLGKPLPQRKSIVLTRNPSWLTAGATVAHTMSEAIAACDTAAVAWVIGGAQLYTQAMPWVQECHITEIQANFVGDAFFNALDPTQWLETKRIAHTAQPPSNLAFDTVVYHRVKGEYY